MVWIISAYNLLVVALVMTAGTLGDLVGRRRVFAIGAFVFAASSGLAVASHGMGLLITAAALMGVGGAAVLATSLRIVSHTFTDPHERTTAISAWAALPPAAMRGTVLESAARAFTHTTHLSLIVGGIVLIAMAIPTALLARHRNVQVTETMERPNDAGIGAREGVR